ncbi:MAG: hypothetical protein AAF602_08925 [Myxococcota bacterium]
MSLYVDELFQELSQLPADQREAVIVERCADDPAAEAQLRALLSAEVTFSEPLAIETGTELERYRLERKLGEGATASDRVKLFIKSECCGNSAWRLSLLASSKS